MVGAGLFSLLKYASTSTLGEVAFDAGRFSMDIKYCHSGCARLLSVLLLCSLRPLSAAEPEKLPIPDDAAQRSATAILNDVYGGEQKKLKSGKDRIALAQKLLNKAREGEDEPAIRYALLHRAKDIGIQAGDFSVVAQAIDALDEIFETPALTWKLDALKKIAAGPKANVKQQTSIAAEALGLIDVALAEDKHSVAGELGQVGLRSAAKAKNAALTASLTQRVADVEQAKQDFDALQTALAILKTTPADPAANLAVGRYYCFVRGDWDGGLPMLARGSDEPLRALARKELEHVSSAADQLALAEGWWDLGSDAAKSTKTKLQGRAAFWYENALPGLSGLSQLKAEKRLLETKEANGGVARRIPTRIELKITKATFGVADKQTDVTAVLEKVIGRSGFQVIQADPRVMGDPAFGEAKRLIVTGRFAERPFSIDLGESDVAAFPQFPDSGTRVVGASNNFVILAARFGAGLTWKDVTDLFARHVPDTDTKFHLYDLFKDLPDQWEGVHKHLVVWFDYRGVRYVRIVQDSDTRSLLP